MLSGTEGRKRVQPRMSGGSWKIAAWSAGGQAVCSALLISTRSDRTMDGTPSLVRLRARLALPARQDSQALVEGMSQCAGPGVYAAGLQPGCRGPLRGTGRISGR
jgi:hypothetical protein